MVNYKKILIISHNALSLHSNNGKTLNSIFSGWPAENIAQLYFQEEVPESSKFKKFFRIRDLDILKTILNLGRSDAGQTIEPRAYVRSHYSSSEKIKSLALNYLRKTDSIKIILREAIYKTNLWNNKSLNDWILDFAPDSIFFVGGNSPFSFKIANEVSKKYNAPLDIYITDDYILNAKPSTLIQKWLHKKLLLTYKESYKNTRYAFVIGDEMAISFKKQFLREFIPIMNSVDIPQNIPINHHPKINKSIDIVYAGGLHLGRDESIICFAKIINRISKEIGKNISLTVYSQQTPKESTRSKFKENSVLFGGSLKQSEISDRLLAADFVLHTESFSEKYCNLTKLSISTKIPEYLSSGSCLIAFGPPQLASIKIIKNNNIGICLTSLNLDHEEKSKLVVALTSPEEKLLLIQNGYDFAKKNFDITVTKAKVESRLNN